MTFLRKPGFTLLLTLMVSASGLAQAPGQRLIATYGGTLPCADCQGIRTVLQVYSKNPKEMAGATFRLRETWLGGSNRTVETKGQLQGESARVYRLVPTANDQRRFYRVVNDDEVRLLDPEQRENSSKLNYSLKKFNLPQPVGSYAPVDDLKDSDLRKAAAFAVAEQSNKVKRPLTLTRVARAQTQMVAGLNYWFCLEVADADAQREAVAVVYRDLKHRLKLTRWQPGVCH